MQETLERRRALEKKLTRFNAIIYVVLFGALITEVFTDGYSVMQPFYGIGCSIMLGMLLYSYKRVAAYINSLNYKGVYTADKTIRLQLVCLGITSVLNISQLVTSLIYNRDCRDDIDAVSIAGVVGSIFGFIIVCLWKVITVTFVIFFLKQTQKVPPSDLNRLMIDFAKRFASDNDDTVYSGEIIEEEDS